MLICVIRALDIPTRLFFLLLFQIHAMFFMKRKKRLGARLKDFINTQYLKYKAHVCRCPNSNLTKLSLFITPKCRYYRDPWIKISKLLGGIPVEQAKRETQSKTGFIGLIRKNLTSGESNSEGL